LSDGATTRRTGSVQSRSRSKRPPRGGRRWQSRAAESPWVSPAIDIEEAEPGAAVAPARVLRRTRPGVSTVVALPREVEYAYIRSDMRRLLIIAGALLALMLVILILVER
jgi:hypothetical protein